MPKKVPFLFLLMYFMVLPSVRLSCPGADEMASLGSKEFHSDNSVVLPKEKLPWPHQRPDLSQSEFNALIDSMWILDNFGTYHATEGEYLYFHDGIDIMLANNTNLYAVESGYVKSLRVEPSGGGHINIGDTPGDLPGYGWEYAHTGDFQFKVGDYVHKGEFIAKVIVREHVHLSRIRVLNGSWGDKKNLEYFQPLEYFVYKDTIPPEIITPFYYFPNNSDVPFANGYPNEVSGEVDIVVPMRDLAECNLQSSLRRWCLGWIEYEIKGDQSQKVYKKSFDFRKLIFADWPGVMYDERVLAIYKPHYLPIFANSGLDTRNLAFYIITNMEGTKECCEMYDMYQDRAWNTLSLDEDGMPLFPDGLYTITVKAYDVTGNCRTESDVVRVRNNPPISKEN